jgi:hypothetical protein
MTTPGRRLSDLVSEASFMEIRVQVLHESAHSHKSRTFGLRLAALHRRLDAIERQLRTRARWLGTDDSGSVSELRRRLAELMKQAPPYEGVERRRGHRRSARGADF